MVSLTKKPRLTDLAHDVMDSIKKPRSVYEAVDICAGGQIRVSKFSVFAVSLFACET